MRIETSSKDLFYSLDGDFLIDEQGRLEKSTYRHNRLLKNIIAKRLTEIIYGFESSYAIHTNLAGYLGLSEISLVLEELKREIVRKLTVFNFLNETDISFGSSFTEDGLALITLTVRGTDPNADHVELGLIIDSRTNTFKVQYINQKEF